MQLAPYAVKDMTESGSIVPEATYHLRIVKFEYNDPHDEVWKAAHTSSEAKDPYLKLDTVITDESVQDANNASVPVLGRHLYTTLTFKKGGDFMLRGLLEALNKDPEWMLVDEDGVPHWDELVESEVMGVVTTQPEKPNPKKPGEKYAAKSEIKKFISVL